MHPGMYPRFCCYRDRLLFVYITLSSASKSHLGTRLSSHSRLVHVAEERTTPVREQPTGSSAPLQPTLLPRKLRARRCRQSQSWL